jgi:hypothetical protein
MKKKLISLGFIAFGVLLGAIITLNGAFWLGEITCLTFTLLPRIFGPFCMKGKEEGSLGDDVGFWFPVMASVIAFGFGANQLFPGFTFEGCLLGAIVASGIYHSTLYPSGTDLGSKVSRSGGNNRPQGKPVARLVAEAMASTVTGPTSGAVSQMVREQAAEYKTDEQLRNTKAVNPTGETA